MEESRAERRRRFGRERQQRYRARQRQETFDRETLDRLRKEDAKRKADRRKQETPEQTEARRAANALSQANRRKQETPEQREVRRAANALSQANRRKQETPEQTEARRAAKALSEANRHLKNLPSTGKQLCANLPEEMMNDITDCNLVQSIKVNTDLDEIGGMMSDHEVEESGQFKTFEVWLNGVKSVITVPVTTNMNKTFDLPDNVIKVEPAGMEASADAIVIGEPESVCSPSTNVTSQVETQANNNAKNQSKGLIVSQGLENGGGRAVQSNAEKSSLHPSTLSPGINGIINNGLSAIDGTMVPVTSASTLSPGINGIINNGLSAIDGTVVPVTSASTLSPGINGIINNGLSAADGTVVPVASYPDSIGVQINSESGVSNVSVASSTGMSNISVTSFIPVMSIARTAVMSHTGITESLLCQVLYIPAITP